MHRGGIAILAMIDERFGSNLLDRNLAITESLGNAINHIPNMTAGEWGEATGGALFTIAGTKGLTAIKFVKGVKIAKGGTTGFRYMSQAELKAIQETGHLRGGISGETYFTKDLYKSAAHAQSRLSLGSSPALRVEFEILNNPALLRNGTKVLPANGMIGRGAEFMTTNPVKVRLINWQPLR